MQFPKYLDDLIFGELGAVYEQNAQLAAYNLDNDEAETRRYLGTYFPRSFAESVTIMQELFSNESIRQVFAAKDELNILDVGAGTGGNLTGLAHFLCKKGFKDKQINIISIDGNELAIKAQNIIIKRLNRHFGTEIKLIPMRNVFDDASDLLRIPEALGEHCLKFDMIMSFKFINEFFAKAAPDESNGIYRALIEGVRPLLAENGLMLLLDITAKNNDSRRQYPPVILAQELRSYIHDGQSNLQIIQPTACALWGNTCKTSECYTQRTISISHSRKTDDISKVTYRVMAPTEFSDRILEAVSADAGGYQISDNQWHPRFCLNGQLHEMRRYRPDIFQGFGVIQNG